MDPLEISQKNITNTIVISKLQKHSLIKSLPGPTAKSFRNNIISLAEKDHRIIEKLKNNIKIKKYKLIQP